MATSASTPLFRTGEAIGLLPVWEKAPSRFAFSWATGLGESDWFRSWDFIQTELFAHLEEAPLRSSAGTRYLVSAEDLSRLARALASEALLSVRLGARRTSRVRRWLLSQLPPEFRSLRGVVTRLFTRAARRLRRAWAILSSGVCAPALNVRSLELEKGAARRATLLLRTTLEEPNAALLHKERELPMEFILSRWRGFYVTEIPPLAECVIRGCADTR